MYTLEERMKAVQLYIESGFSEGAVVSELGYSSYTAQIQCPKTTLYRSPKSQSNRVFFSSSYVFDSGLSCTRLLRSISR